MDINFLKNTVHKKIEHFFNKGTRLEKGINFPPPLVPDITPGFSPSVLAAKDQQSSFLLICIAQLVQNNCSETTFKTEEKQLQFLRLYKQLEIKVSSYTITTCTMVPSSPHISCKCSAQILQTFKTQPRLELIQQLFFSLAGKKTAYLALVNSTS